MVPSRYELDLEPDLNAATFHGYVSVDVTAIDDTDVMVLNSADLSIVSCKFDGLDAPFELDERSQRLFIRPEGGVVVGDHVLDIEFDGILNDHLHGWYRSTYRDGDGNEQVIATTQMQSTDCRRAFPCWDEPDFKAVFGVTLVVAPELLAVSNCREISRTDREGLDGSPKEAITFADTMVMSSYLVAFVVGPLVATEWVDVDGIPIRLVCVPGKESLTQFGLDVTAFCLRWFQDYYGIPYPSDKVDLLALPDFAAGAMENLGCITFRESLLLVNPATATQYERQAVADVVAHELAHMWFGDLVTMKWWNGIWLNEAFATFMEMAACDAYRPEWERWTSFGLEKSVAFEVDSLSSTRSVEFPVKSPADCAGMFDVLTYQKGGALLRMLEQHLGEEQFREGVSHYLRTHAHANTDTSDLWDAIEHTSGAPVRRIMDSWIWQPGYPLVSAGLSADGTELVLSQRRFSFNPEDVSTSLWAIPIGIRQDRLETRVLLDSDELRIDLGESDGPIVLNTGGHGFFRVAYDDALRSRLTPEAVATMGTLERYNLVDDAWNAVVAGSMDATDFVTLAEQFGGERELSVWQSLAIGLRSVRRLISDSDAAVGGFERRIVALVGPVLADLGEPAAGEPDLTAKLRGLMLSIMALQGADQAACDRAAAVYAAALNDPTSVDADLVAAATGIVAATGDAATYDGMLDRALHGETPQEQQRHLYALADFGDAELMARTCELALSDAVKTQNAPYLLRRCIANREHGEQAWKFVRQHWDEANQKFPENTISRMVDAVKLLDQPAQVADVHAFFVEHPVAQALQTMEQILERQRVNAALRARSVAPLVDQLSEL